MGKRDLPDIYAQAGPRARVYIYTLLIISFAFMSHHALVIELDGSNSQSNYVYSFT